MTFTTFMEVLGDTCLDALKSLPILLLAYLLITFFEHIKEENYVHKMRGNYSTVIFGSLLGIVPQCAFSAFSADMYSKKKIPMGTLIAIFIACSDEAIPLLISKIGTKTNVLIDIVYLVVGKVVLGITVGLVINFIFAKRNKKIEIHHHHHEEDEHHCCADSVFVEAIKQTLKIFLLVIISTYAINLVVEFIGLKNLQKFMLSAGSLSILLVTLVGLIPSCASSILIIEMFIEGIIPFGTMFAGLVAGAGIGYIVLFKENRPMWKNLLVVLIMYGAGVGGGFLMDFILKLI